MLGRVTRAMFGKRWRWCVTPIEVVDRCPSKPIERAIARGFAGTRDRAIEMAEMSIVAMVKATKEDARKKR
jgi:hypothetical protein